LLLARTPDPSGSNAAESFRLGELIRGRSVQKALTASSARIVARDAALADLVRKEQDYEKQIGAQIGALNNMLAQPPEERDEKAVVGLRVLIDNLRTQRTAARRDIERRFPEYANLVAPKPATVEEVRAALKVGEAYLSFWFGPQSSYVWAVAKDGPVAFAAVPLRAIDVDKKIQELRLALDPEATTIDDIPPFNISLANELYADLLKPVEAGWKSARNLIVATDGALGMLPLGLLVTEPATQQGDTQPAFAGYRAVPWLSRTHAVSMIPSAAALLSLRRLPSVATERNRMIGFGDPVFNERQVADELDDGTRETIQIADATVRGLPLRRRSSVQTQVLENAELGLLPRLPDTADELRSIALALQADPSKVLYLGKAATEQRVKTSDLSKYRVVVFATHGLVPGDLAGLTQPALALSSPSVTGTMGDGLLTTEEILALKLNADWVVLSACNTGAASGAGAEAASGLGRAFFYAGTRAVLVTNWSVHSTSARELVTDLFRRQAADPNLSRGEALRQAAVALLDGKGFTDPNGNTLFTYAHPLFWAPYTIIGDGGRR
jgi:CHAT domain-containing protein